MPHQSIAPCAAKKFKAWGGLKQNALFYKKKKQKFLWHLFFCPPPIPKSKNYKRNWWFYFGGVLLDFGFGPPPHFYSEKRKKFWKKKINHNKGGPNQTLGFFMYWMGFGANIKCPSQKKFFQSGDQNKTLPPQTKSLKR